MRNQDYGTVSQSLGQKYQICLKKSGMTTRAALGKRRKVQRGKLSDQFCLVGTAGSMEEASLENQWYCFRKMCSLSLQLMGKTGVRF